MYATNAIEAPRHPFTSTFTDGPVIFFKWGKHDKKKPGKRSKKERWGVEFVSPNVLQLGFHQENFLNKKNLLIDLFHPDDRAKIEEGEKLLSRNKGKEHCFKGEFRVLTPADVTRWVYFYTVTNHPLQLAHSSGSESCNDDSVCSYYSYIIDLTGQKHAEEAIEILARFPDENPNPVIRVTENGSLVYANDAGLALIKMWQKEGEQPVTMFCSRLLKEVQQRGEKKECEVEIGDAIYLFTLTPIANTDCIYLYGTDITEKKKAEEELKLAAIVYESSIQGIIVTDADGNIQSINPTFTNITGYRPDEVIGKNPRILKSNRHDSHFYKRMWASIRNTGRWQGEIWNRRKNGETYPELLSISTIKDDNGHVTHFVGVFNDILELKQKESEIEYQAYHDPLTGLPNRSLFNDRLQMEISRTFRSETEQKLAVVFLDLDNFKDINDSLGHAIGDYLLQDVAKRLLECVRDVDTVARIGGDEFTIILPQIMGFNEIVLVAQRILDVFKEPFNIQGHELFSTASIGVSIYPSDGTDIDDLLKYADLAMYHAKDLGKNNYAFFSQEMNVQMKKRLAMENQLRHGLRTNQFLLHYQPLVDIASGEMVGVEALIRWDHPTAGIIAPGEFIPLAEETGLILKIGQWVLETGCRQNLEWHHQGVESLYVSVNVSSIQFYRADFLQSIEDILNETGLSTSSLTLQVTENSIMGNRKQIVDIMTSLKEVGIKISIDDFGMGFSSLNYLRSFPVDTLKIDRTFIKGIPHDSDSVAIARSIIALARNLNIKVLAEGVENKEQLNFLVTHGCDLIQGYYYSPPVPPEVITQLIKEKKNLYS